MIRVVLVDDHASAREPLALLLGLEPDIEVAGQAGSVAEARALTAGADVALIDLSLPDGDGVEVIEAFTERQPDGVALVLTGNNNPDDWARAIEFGAVGVLYKAAPVADVIAAVRAAVAGEPILPPAELLELLGKAARRRTRDRRTEQLVASLTAREREVLQALANGLSDKEIAEELSVSHKTVRAHMANILGKLNLTSRVQALIFAVRHGLVVID